MITIYDTDEKCRVDHVDNNYNINNDLQMMLKTIEKVQFIENLYETDGIRKYQKVDSNS